MNNKQENLLQSCLTRLSTIDNNTRKRSETLNEQSSIKTKITNFFKPFLSLLITIFIATPLLFTAQSFLNAKSESIYYSITNQKNSYAPKYIVDLQESKEKEYKFGFNLLADINVYKGTIKTLYCVYSNDDENNFSSENFHLVDLKGTHSTVLDYYHYLVTPFSRSKFIIENYKLKQTISFGSFQKSKQKNIYLVSIDNKNNINLDILNVENQAKMQQTDTKDGNADIKIIPDDKNLHLEDAKHYSAEDFLNLEQYKYKDLGKIKKIEATYNQDKSKIISILKEYDLSIN